MDHAAFLVAIREQSERFLDVLRDVPDDAPVPPCADWTAGDLLWHLAQVQHGWAAVARGARSDDAAELDRPGDAAGLRSLVARSGTELLRALAERDPADPTWSWHADGGSIAWVARRQAHEALIHRVDAELTAGVDVRPPSAALAADGVDEVLTVFISGVPEWGSFTPDGTRVRLTCTNVPARWDLVLGRFTGTSPVSGTSYDLDAAMVQRGGTGAAPDLTVGGHAWDLDRWLWGRGPVTPLAPAGDLALMERVRALARDSTA